MFGISGQKKEGGKKQLKTSGCRNSPLCSPKNTSLNFLRGFPKSPPADMVTDRELNLDYFRCSYRSASPPLWVRRGILLSSQNDGNAAQHPPVNLRSLCACATSPISVLHLFIGDKTMVFIHQIYASRLSYQSKWKGLFGFCFFVFYTLFFFNYVYLKIILQILYTRY